MKNIMTFWYEQATFDETLIQFYSFFLIWLNQLGV